ncbi:hypothetical protein ACU686_19605 [Yinghuangia aomiensis]
MVAITPASAISIHLSAGVLGIALVLGSILAPPVSLAVMFTGGGPDGRLPGGRSAQP